MVCRTSTWTPREFSSLVEEILNKSWNKRPSRLSVVLSTGKMKAISWIRVVNLDQDSRSDFPEKVDFPRKWIYHFPFLWIHMRPFRNFEIESCPLVYCRNFWEACVMKMNKFRNFVCVLIWSLFALPNREKQKWVSYFFHFSENVEFRCACGVQTLNLKI